MRAGLVRRKDTAYVVANRLLGDELTGPVGEATTSAARDVNAWVAPSKYVGFLLADIPSGRHTKAAVEAAGTGAKTAIAEHTVTEIDSVARRLGQSRAVVFATGTGLRTRRCRAVLVYKEDSVTVATLAPKDDVAVSIV